jgi:hypothetical protein
MSIHVYGLIALAVLSVSSLASAHENVTLSDIEVCRAVDLSVDVPAAAEYYVATQPIYKRITDQAANPDHGISLNRHYVFEGQITERFLILSTASQQEKLSLVKSINQMLRLQGASYQCIQDLDS